MDAKANAVTVEIKDGGMTLIRVTDNGIGIPKDQVKTAIFTSCDKQDPLRLKIC